MFTNLPTHQATMPTSFDWKIADLERKTTDGYVYIVHYTVSATNGSYCAGTYGSLGLDRPKGNLIPFSDLTEEVVVDWVKKKFGDEKIAEIETALQTQLDEQVVPTKVSGLPWD